MQRSTLPLVLLMLLVGAVVLYFRPIQLGNLAALAENWDLPAWFEANPRPPVQRVADGWTPTTPQRPAASARPASWPGNPPPGPNAQAGLDAVPRPPQEDRPPDGAGPLGNLPPRQAGQAEYPETGYPAYEGRWGGRPWGRNAERIGPPADEVWSDPFGDRSGLPVADSPAVPCPEVEILARVGSDVVFAREVSLGIAQLREKNKEVPASVLEPKIREELKRRVEERVEEKLICQDAQRALPKDRFAKIMDQYSSAFDKQQVPEMMKRMNLGSRRELEAALRQAGVSLEIYKRGFIEKVLAQQWLKTAVKADEDVPYDELLRYYREHAGEFLDHPPRARWEQLTVQTARFPSREAAYAALAEMGNQVLDGAPLAEVAKARSQGVNAARGGSWDWTSKGALRSKVLDEAIFTLPVGRLSEIIEDDQGFHIVRVIERQPAAMKPFADAQAEIKKTIQSRRQADAKAAFIARLRQQTPVWTAFDNDRSPESTRIDALFR